MEDGRAVTYARNLNGGSQALGEHRSGGIGPKRKNYVTKRDT